MEIEYLRRFVTVGKNLNFRKASELLYISQPTLSHSISNLEKEVGVQLLIRNTKEVRLTEEGVKFLDSAVKIINLYDKLLHDISAQSNEQDSILKIGYAGAAIDSTLTAAIREYRAEDPKTALHIIRQHSIETKEALENRSVQIAIMYREYAEDIPGIKFDVFIHEKYRILISSSHPLAGSPSLTLEQVKDLPLIVCQRKSAPYYRDHILSLFSSKGLSPVIGQEVQRIGDIPRLVDMDMGYAILSNTNNELYMNYDLTFIPIAGCEENGNMYHDRVIAWSDKLSPAAGRFKDYILKHR